MRNVPIARITLSTHVLPACVAKDTEGTMNCAHTPYCLCMSRSMARTSSGTVVPRWCVSGATVATTESPADNLDIRQPQSMTRPHRHVGQVLGQLLELQGRSLDGSIQLYYCLRRVGQVRPHVPHDASNHSRHHLIGQGRRPQRVLAPAQQSFTPEYMFLLHGCYPPWIEAQAQVGHRALGA